MREPKKRDYQIRDEKNPEGGRNANENLGGISDNLASEREEK